jgi:hypothetical protein
MEEAPAQVSLNREEQEGETTALHRGEDEAKKNTTSCGTLAVRSRDEEAGWQPPSVTHEFTYSSDEEIVPNPTANFSRALLPGLGHVRSWFKGAEAAAKSSTSEEEVDSLLPPHHDRRWQKA